MKNLINTNFNYLVVKKFDHKNTNKNYWLCQCYCGNFTIVREDKLMSGHTKSCGCLHKKTTTKHGSFSKDASPLQIKFYKVWDALKYRCLNKNCKFFPRYGGRGITVCDRWLKFENFRNDMYESYLKHVKEFGLNRNTSLDRIDVNGNYKPSNCRWATTKEQGRNKQNSPKTKNYPLWKRKKEKIRNLIRAIIHYKTKTHKPVKYLGCSPFEFVEYINSLFVGKMSWDNYGTYWVLDHIVPLREFDLVKESDCYKAFHYSNYQPLQKNKNRTKW